ncbi:MAG: PASTA domain-containing protein [Actinomycetota bacterium]
MPDARDLLMEAVGSYEPRGDLGAVERRVERHHRRQRVSAGLVAFAVFAAAGWFALTVFRTGEGTPGSTPTPPAAAIVMPNVVGMSQEEAIASLEALDVTVSVTTEPSDEIDEGVVASQDPRAGAALEPGTSVTIVVSGPVSAEPVPLGDLPEVGVAVGSGDAVELIAVDGRVVTTLRGFTLAGNAGAPGVWLQRGEQLFTLNVEERALIPVTAAEAGDRPFDEGPEPPLAPPPGAEGQPGGAAGHWRYAIGSASGVTLGQWSGECEDPTAYWIASGGAARIVTGEVDASSAPASSGLGWTNGGEALVLVQDASCGADADQPGIYVYSAPDVGRLVHPTDAGPVAAEAWGAGV